MATTWHGRCPHECPLPIVAPAELPASRMRDDTSPVAMGIRRTGRWPGSSAVHGMWSRPADGSLDSAHPSIAFGEKTTDTDIATQSTADPLGPAPSPMAVKGPLQTSLCTDAGLQGGGVSSSSWQASSWVSGSAAVQLGSASIVL